MFYKNIHIIIIGLLSALVLSDNVLAQSQNPDLLRNIKPVVPKTARNRALDSIALQTDSLKLPVDSTKKERIEAPINYQAQDSIFVDFTANKMKMYNKSQITYQGQKIDAYFIEGDMKKNVVNATFGLDTAGLQVGYPVIKDKDKEMEGEELSYNMKTKKALVKGIITQEGEGYIQSNISKKISEDTFYLRDGRYTTCDDHDHPHYYIKLKKAKMIKEKKVVTGLAYLVIEDVKLPLFVPFGLFPLNKKFSSGIIIPSFGEEKERGFYFHDFGYYWAASKYFDMQFKGSLYTNGSWKTEVQTSYKKRYKYDGSFQFSYATNFYGDEGLDDYQKQKDYALRWTHRQDSKAHPYRSLSASVDISSLQNDYRNTRSLNSMVRNRKQSSISYGRRWPDSPFALRVTLQHSQNTQEKTVSMTLPDITFTMQTQYPFRPKNRAGKMKWYDKISVGYSSSFKNMIKTDEDKLFKSNFKRDWRNGFQHSIPIGASYKLARDLTFSANLNYKAVAYLNSVRKSYDPIKNDIITDTIDGFYYAQNFTTSTSLAFNPKFFGMYSFGKDSKIQAIRHVISPTVSFSYTPDLGLNDDKYFRTYSNNYSDNEVRYNILRDNIFGVPGRAMKSGRVNFSLGNNIEMKVRNDDTTSNEEFKKIKLLESFTISTGYDLFADSMKFSNIRISGRTSFLKNKVQLNMGAMIDPYALDESGRRINKFAGGLGRLTTATFSLQTSLDGNTFKADDKEESNNQDNADRNGGLPNDAGMFGDAESRQRFDAINEYVDFKIPWSVSLNYDFSYRKSFSGSDITQNLRINGDMNLTEKWKLSVSTGYDFAKSEVTATSFTLVRDLHCWDLRFYAIPFGKSQSYEFKIAVKSSMLRDLKYEKRDSWYNGNR